MSNLNWMGAEVLNQLSRRLTAALDEIDLRIESRAKQELRPGHGKRTGTLQRDIHSTPARREGIRIVGVVGAGRHYSIYVHEGVKAKMRTSKRGRAFHHRGQSAIPYLKIGFDHVEPQAAGIVARHTGR